jgi:hypothetical protein
MERISTSDIFKGASLLCLGAELDGLRRRGRDVTFYLKGTTVKKDDIRYRTGQVQVNPLQLKESLNLLRDLIFDKAKYATREMENTYAPHRRI